jgi:hypothetical protein
VGCSYVRMAAGSSASVAGEPDAGFRSHGQLSFEPICPPGKRYAVTRYLLSFGWLCQGRNSQLASASVCLERQTTNFTARDSS